MLNGLLLAASVCGCTKTDLGSPCHLISAQGSEVIPNAGRAYLFLGSPECENFVCAAEGGGAGYCSSPCTGPQDNCGGGLSCRSISLDKNYRAQVQTRMAAADYAKLFGKWPGDYYCQR